MSPSDRRSTRDAAEGQSRYQWKDAELKAGGQRLMRFMTAVKGDIKSVGVEGTGCRVKRKTTH